jgi:hypothetical protein
MSRVRRTRTVRTPSIAAIGAPPVLATARIRLATADCPILCGPGPIAVATPRARRRCLLHRSSSRQRRHHIDPPGRTAPPISLRTQRRRPRPWPNSLLIWPVPVIAWQLLPPGQIQRLRGWPNSSLRIAYCMYDAQSHRLRSDTDGRQTAERVSE